LGWGPYLFLSDATVSEGNTGTANADFTLTLAHASNVDLTFNYNTADGSATASSDYRQPAVLMQCELDHLPHGSFSKTAVA
jgi:hypothetical protein